MTDIFIYEKRNGVFPEQGTRLDIDPNNSKNSIARMKGKGQTELWNGTIWLVTHPVTEQHAEGHRANIEGIVPNHFDCDIQLAEGQQGIVELNGSEYMVKHLPVSRGKEQR